MSADDKSTTGAKPDHRTWFARYLPVVLLYAGVLILGVLVSQFFVQTAMVPSSPTGSVMLDRLMFPALFVYVLATSIPFVPGAEIGLALLVAAGTAVAVFVYLATLLALILAYSVGRFLPPHILARGFKSLGLTRAGDFVEEMAPLTSEERMDWIVARAPKRAVPMLLRNRYIAFGILINLPGNTFLGGGGGLSMAAGMSGLFSFVPFLITIALAAAPIPVLFLTLGYAPVY